MDSELKNDTVYGIIILLHKSILSLIGRRFSFGKNALSALRPPVGNKDLCSDKWGRAFFGVWLHLDATHFLFIEEETL